MLELLLDIEKDEEPWDLISDLLLSFGIKHEICEDRTGIKVDRDSIISNTIPSPTRDEQGHYDRLMVKLKNNFKCRFFYASKTDDWLLLSVIK